MSNENVNNQQANTRTKLKGYFDNNQTPTGEQFAEFIESVLMKEDDALYMSADKSKLGIGDSAPQATLSVNSSAEDSALVISSEGKDLLRIDKSRELDVSIPARFQKSVDIEAELTICGTKSITDENVEGDVNPLRIENRVVDENARNATMETAVVVNADGKVGINTDNPQVTLDVAGAAHIWSELEVDGTLEVNSPVSIMANPSSEPSLGLAYDEGCNTGDVIRVQSIDSSSDINTHMVLDTQGHLALGANNAKAKLHISQGNNENDAIFRIDDHLGDTTPMIVNAEGRLGIGLEDPVNKVDIAGNMRIGSHYGNNDDVPADSLVVESKVGVNTLTPTAHVHIVAADAVEGLHIESAGRDLLRVNCNTISTDNCVKASSLEVAGKVCGQQLKVQEGANISGGLTVEETLQVTGCFSVSELANMDGQVLVNPWSQDKESPIGEDVAFSVRGKTELEGQLLVHNKTTFRNDTEVEGKLGVDSKVDMRGAVDIEGPLQASKSVSIALEEHPSSANLHVGFSDQEPVALRVDAISGDDSTTSTEGSDSQAPALIIRDGKTGIGVEDPQCELEVVGETHLKGEVKLDGMVTIDSAPLRINCGPNDGKPVEAFTVYHQDPSNPADVELTFRDGKLGIGKADPTAELDIQGEAKIAEKLTVAGEAGFSAGITIKGESQLEGSLSVEKNTCLKANAQINGQVKIGLDCESHSNAVQADSNESPVVDLEPTSLHIGQQSPGFTALRVDQFSPNPENNLPAALLVKDSKLGINTDNPCATLDVSGSANITNNLTIENQLSVAKAAEFNSIVRVDDSLGINLEPEGLKARLHIQEDDETTPLRVDSKTTDCQSTLLYKSGRLGIGTDDPACNLDLRGDAAISNQLTVKGEASIEKQLLVGEGTCIGDELKVHGRTYLEHSLDVGHDALLKSDLTVLESTTLKDRVKIGDPDCIAKAEAQSSQLYIADVNYAEALRIETMLEGKKDSLVVQQGRLGLGVENPESKLDVNGSVAIREDAKVHGKLKVQQAAHLPDNLEVHGSLTVAQRANFSSDANIKGDLKVEDKLDVEEGLSVGENLTVLGRSRLENTHIGKNANIEGNLCVESGASFKSSISVKGPITSGGDTASAQLHVQTQEQYPALKVDRKREQGNIESLLIVDENGNIGLGTSQPKSKLDVMGNAEIHGELRSMDLLEAPRVRTQSLALSDTFTGSNSESPIIRAFSSDTRLGDREANHETIPTQLAIKTYIDSAVSAFGNHGQTIIVDCQEAFDKLFNKGVGTRLPNNASIILLPLKDSYDNTSSYFPYRLNNSVIVPSGVSIVGFNPFTTVVLKTSGHCRFELHGNAEDKVANVNFYGWSFNGGDLETDNNGGAFFLNYAENCTLNCHIYGHITTAHGGAIYGQKSTGITAEFIRNCRAIRSSGGTHLSEGGAVYGLSRSLIVAENCSANFGGAAARCDHSQVKATNCEALDSGGAAYRCNLLRLTATDCHAGKQGGGACYCADLMCEGIWLGNRAASGPNIFANNGFFGGKRECHFWTGTYVGKRINLEACTWRSDNE